MNGRFCLIAALVIGSMNSLLFGGLLVRNEAGLDKWGYGEDWWDDFTSYIDTAFGGSENITAVDLLPDQSVVLTYDALMINQCYDGANPLSSAESQAIQAFIATGRPVLLIGEANGWTDWNDPLLELVGGAYADGEVYYESLAPVSSHELVTGVGAISVNYGGQAEASASSESLFGQNVFTLWGAQQNTLAALDTNIFNDLFLDEQDNRIFAQNVAEWLSPSPEPTTLGLLSLGAVGLFSKRRKCGR